MKLKSTVFFLSALAMFVTLTVISGCKKETPAAQVADTPTSSYSLKGLLGNEPVDIHGGELAYTDVTNANTEGEHGGCGEHHDGNDDNGGVGGDQDEDDELSVISSGCTWSTTGSDNKMLTVGVVEVRGLVVRIWVNPAVAESYFNLFTPGIHSFAYNNGAKAGAYVAVRDASGMLWTSKGDQTGSTFEILTRGENSNSNTVITGVVNCKLYDSNGNVKDFTNGAFSATVGL